MMCSVIFSRIGVCATAVGMNVLHWFGPLVAPPSRR